MMSKERIICITTVDKNSQTLNESEATIVVCDSTFFPVHIANKGINIIVSKTDDSHFDCIVYTQENDEWIEYNNFEYNLEDISRVISTRAPAVGGYSEFNLNNALKVLSISTNIVNGIRKGMNDDILGFFGENLQILSQYNDEIGLGIGLSLTPGWFNLLPVAEYLTGKFEKLVIKEMGKVHFTIEDPKILDGTTCEVFYEITGLNQNGIDNSEVGMEIYNSNGYYNWAVLESGNYKSSQKWQNLSTGRYTIEFYVKSKKYQWLEFRAMKTFYIFELELERYEIKPDVKYANGKVTFDIDVFLKGDVNELNEWGKHGAQFGYYTRYANATPDYKRVEHLSSIFESTPLTYELSIDKDGFSNESMNYTTFEAKPANDYYIGAYVVLNNGDILHLDETSIDGLIYKTRPSIKFISANVTNTEILDIDEENGKTKYASHYKFDCEVKGTFWFNNIQYQIYNGNVTNSWEGQTLYEDGIYTMNGIFTHYSSSSVAHTCYYQMFIHDGSTINSDNTLVFSGNPGSPYISIGGAPLNISTQVSRNAYLQNIDYESFAEIENYSPIK